MQNREQMEKDFIKGYETMSDEQKEAVCWFIVNRGTVEELCKGEKIPDDEMKSLIKRAIDKKDYFMLLLALYKEQVDKDSDEERKISK